ncbi:MAG: hypothetical protein IPM16_07200 [Chloroflexi bacterium]|nr:hypothetical protein [Chloroflexota bacterium]
MSRFIRLVLVMALLLPLPTSAQNESHTCAPGPWILYYAIGFRYGSTILPGWADWTEYAKFDVEVTCSGTNGTFTGSGTGKLEIENSLSAYCESDFNADVSGPVDYSTGFPVYTANIALQYTSGGCGGGSPGGAIVRRLFTNELFKSTQFEEFQGNYLDGFLLAETFSDEEIIVEAYVVAAQRNYDPKLVSTMPQLIRYFIRDVPLTNTFTFNFDWDGAPEPTAELSVLGGDWQPLNISGDTASHLLSVTGLPLTAADFAGSESIEVTMDMRFPFMNGDPFPVSPDQIRTTIVDVPSWAVASDFAHIGAPGSPMHIIYQTYKDVPAQAIQTPIIPVPEFVPVVGGSWGLEPVQMRVNVGVHSAGIMHEEDIQGSGTLHFAGKLHNFQYEGKVRSSVTASDGIVVLDSPFTFSLEPIVIEDVIPLSEFIPVVNFLFEIPVIGGLLEDLFSPVFIQVKVTGTANGSGVIGVLPTGELGIKEGTVTLTVTGQAAGGANLLNLFWFGLGSTIAGNLELDLAPVLETKQCNLQMGVFIVGGTPFGTLDVPQAFVQIPICNP